MLSSSSFTCGMGNICSSEEKRGRRLAVELDSQIIHGGSLDDVKALLRRGAPVNGRLVNLGWTGHEFDV